MKIIASNRFISGPSEQGGGGWGAGVGAGGPWLPQYFSAK